MKHRNYLFLHKHEYDRLKNQGTPPQKSTKPSEKDEYIKSMNEQSQNWIKNWPDTVKGHIFRLEKEKEKQHAKDTAIIKLFRKEKRIVEKNDAVQKAKQMIFEDSCYGRQLYSALLESKTLEERDIQVQFQKKIAEDAKKLEENRNSIECTLQKLIDTEKKEKEIAKSKREKNKEMAEINKRVYLNRNEITRREKEKQQQDEIKDMYATKKLLEKETAEEVNRKHLWKQDLKLCIAERKIIEQRKDMGEKEEERNANFWRKYQDKINDRMKMIHKKRFEVQHTKNYDLLNKLKNEDVSRYDEFVNKGIIAAANRLKQEEINNRTIENERKKRYLLPLTNEPITETIETIKSNKSNDTCDRQCIITKCKNFRKTETPFVKQPYHQQELMLKSMELVKNLEKIKSERTPWSGLAAAHAQFARQANDTLKECRYKNMARKVVDDYRRLNCLNDETLPISNYF